MQTSFVYVSIIEDERLVLNSLKGLIGSHADLKLAQTAQSVEAYLAADHEHAPDVILLDIGLPGGMSGLEGISHLKSRFPEAEIIMLTTFDDSDRVFKALCAGASAYLTKRTPFSRIAEAIMTVSRGGSYMSPAIARQVVNYFAPTQSSSDKLTPRQQQIVEGIVNGMSYKMVADKLMISTETVRDHIKNIYRKLEINSKAELIAKKIKGELD